MIQFEIDGDPQGKQRPRHARTGAVYTPTETKAYERKVAWQFWNTKPKPETYHGAVAMEIVAYYRIPASAGKAAAQMMRDGERVPAKKPDIDNVVKIVMDGLNKNAYDDDRQVVQVTARKAYADEPKVVVKVWEI